MEKLWIYHELFAKVNELAINEFIDDLHPYEK